MDTMMFELDAWTRYQWRVHVEPRPEVQAVLKVGSEKVARFPLFGSEVFGRLFAHALTPSASTRPEDEWAKGAHDALDGLSSFQELVERCTGDRLLSSVAATTFAEKVAHELPSPEQTIDDVEELRAQVRGLLALAASATTDEREDIDRVIDGLRTSGREKVERALAYAEAVRSHGLEAMVVKAVQAAAADVEKLEARIGGVAGLGAPTWAGVDTRERAQVAERLMANPGLARLAEVAGRLRRVASKKQASKCDWDASEIVDVELGADLSRLLPHELGLVGHPLLSLDFMRRFAERQLVQRRLVGRDVQGRGPLVVLVDESSSMSGERDAWAKGLSVALLEIALGQKRACRVVRFAVDVVRVHDWGPAAPTAMEVLDALDGFAGGGTRLEPALTSAIESIEHDARLTAGDVVVVSDGEVQLEDTFIADWTSRRRRAQASCYAVHIGDRAPKVLHDIADHVVTLAALTNDGAATDVLFSI